MKHHSGFRKEFFRLWTEKSDQFDVELWEDSDIRAIITRAELLATGGMGEVMEENKKNYRRLNVSQLQNGANDISRSRSEGETCFKCGTYNKRNSSG